MQACIVSFAKEEDLKQVAVLFNQYRCFYQQTSNLAEAQKFLDQRFEKQESKIIVAKLNNEIIGFIQLYPTFSSVAMKKAWILNDLFVAEKARKKGVAEALMKFSIEFCTKDQASYIALETGIDNLKAQALYKKMGFTEDTHALFLNKILL